MSIDRARWHHARPRRTVMLYHRSTGLTWEMADDRAVILDAAGSTLTTLNAVGTLVWRHLDHPRDPSELADHLAEHFPEVGVSELEADVEAFLAQLHDEGLVVVAETS
jgi:hypothetical protein